jgi:hypothetical protein
LDPTVGITANRIIRISTITYKGISEVKGKKSEAVSVNSHVGYLYTMLAIPPASVSSKSPAKE